MMDDLGEQTRLIRQRIYCSSFNKWGTRLEILNPYARQYALRDLVEMYSCAMYCTVDSTCRRL